MRCAQEAKWGAFTPLRSAHIRVWTVGGGAPLSPKPHGNSGVQALRPHPASPAIRPVTGPPLRLLLRSRTATPCWRTRPQRSSMFYKGKMETPVLYFCICIHVNRLIMKPKVLFLFCCNVKVLQKPQEVKLIHKAGLLVCRTDPPEKNFCTNALLQHPWGNVKLLCTSCVRIRPSVRVRLWELINNTCVDRGKIIFGGNIPPVCFIWFCEWICTFSMHNFHWVHPLFLLLCSSKASQMWRQRGGARRSFSFSFSVSAPHCARVHLWSSFMEHINQMTSHKGSILSFTFCWA